MRNLGLCKTILMPGCVSLIKFVASKYPIGQFSLEERRQYYGKDVEK